MEKVQSTEVHWTDIRRFQNTNLSGALIEHTDIRDLSCAEPFTPTFHVSSIEYVCYARNKPRTLVHRTGRALVPRLRHFGPWCMYEVDQASGWSVILFRKLSQGGNDLKKRAQLRLYHCRLERGHAHLKAWWYDWIQEECCGLQWWIWTAQTWGQKHDQRCNEVTSGLRVDITGIVDRPKGKMSSIVVKILITICSGRSSELFLCMKLDSSR